jgi:hypothetical protein
MVNVGFPGRAGYGFEVVDAPGASIHRETRHQSKIYTESNQRHFSQIFEDLSSMQTLAIYRQLLAKD